MSPNTFCDLLYVFEERAEVYGGSSLAKTIKILIQSPVRRNGTPKIIVLCNYLYLKSFIE